MYHSENGSVSRGRTVDVNTLLAQSQRLTAEIKRNNDIPLVYRNIYEIEEEAKRMASADQRTGVNDYSGFRMLASGGYDPQSVSRDLDQIEAQIREEPTLSEKDDNVENFILRRENLISASLLNDTLESANRNVQERRRLLERSSWEKEKARIMREVCSMKEYPADMELSNDAKLDKITVATRFSPTSEKLKKGLIIPPTPQSGLAFERQIYAHVVQRLNRSKDPARPFPVLQEFKAASQMLVKPQMQGGSAVAFSRLWDLLISMLEGNNVNDIQYSDVDVLREQYWISGAIKYLEDVFSSVIEHRLEASRVRGEQPKLASDTYVGKSSLSIKISAFVQLEASQNILSQSSLNPKYKGVPLWPQIYYSLRCGSTENAIKLCEDAIAEGINERDLDDVIHVLNADDDRDEAMEKLIHSYNYMDGNLAAYLHARRSNDIGEMEANPEPNPFKHLVINILLIGDAGSTQTLLGTIEDYMWFKLKFCNTTDKDSSEFNLTHLQEEVTCKYGPTHFDREGNTPYLYASILFMCQLFGEAIRYLSLAGQTVAAVHVAIALASKGYLVQDTAKVIDSNEPLPEENLLEDKLNEESVSNRLLIAIILIYIRLLIHSETGTVLEYLYRIKGRDRETARNIMFQNEAASFLVLSKEYGMLVGEVGRDGRRVTEGILSELVSRSEVDEILFQAGKIALEKGSIDDAISLFGLAGDFFEVLKLLNIKLVQSLTLPPTDDGKRDREESIRRIQDIRKTHFGIDSNAFVQEKIRKMDPQQFQQQLLECLTHLSHFFTLTQQKGKEAEAMRELDSSKLIPTTEIEVPDKLEMFEKIPHGMKAKYSKVLISAMQCLCRQFMELSERLRGVNVNGLPMPTSRVTSQMAELKHRAQLLVHFSALLGRKLPSDTLHSLSSMELRMI